MNYNKLRLRIHETLPKGSELRMEILTYAIQRVRPWPTPEDPNGIITDDGQIIHMTTTEYEQYLERLFDELSSDRCFEWIDRL